MHTSILIMNSRFGNVGIGQDDTLPVHALRDQIDKITELDMKGDVIESGKTVLFRVKGERMTRKKKVKTQAELEKEAEKKRLAAENKRLAAEKKAAAVTEKKRLKAVAEAEKKVIAAEKKAAAEAGKKVLNKAKGDSKSESESESEGEEVEMKRKNEENEWVGTYIAEGYFHQFPLHPVLLKVGVSSNIESRIRNTVTFGGWTTVKWHM